MPDRSDVIGQGWQCDRCFNWTTVRAAMCRVCHSPQTAESLTDDPPCDHIPERTAQWSEPVFACSLCALIQPEAVAMAEKGRDA